LAGLKRLGIPAFYPGRDWITVDRRVVGMVSMDVGPDGGLLFEAAIAASRDFGTNLVGERQSQVAARIAQLEADEVTSLNRELGVEIDVADVAEIMVRGYREQFGLSFTTLDEDPKIRREVGRLATEVFAHDRWTLARQVSWTPVYHGLVDALLGVFETYVSLATTGRLEQVLLSGDVIANSSAIATLEANLKGCPADRASIDEIAAQVFSVPENFVLGIANTSVISTTIMRGLSET
jgi:hypothetical protein